MVGKMEVKTGVATVKKMFQNRWKKSFVAKVEQDVVQLLVLLIKQYCRT